MQFKSGQIIILQMIQSYFSQKKSSSHSISMQGQNTIFIKLAMDKYIIKIFNYISKLKQC